MKIILQSVLLWFASLVLFTACESVAQTAAAPKKLLVVTAVTDYGHSSIGPGTNLVKSLAEKTGQFTLDFANTKEELAAKAAPEALKNYDGAFFLCSQGHIALPDVPGFLNWIKSGKAFIGAHSASDTLHGTPYLEMVGGEFIGHTVAPVSCLVEDTTHPATRHLGKTWAVTDEIYLFKPGSFSRDKVHMLLSLDKAPGSNEPGYYPVAWCKTYGNGKVFYTALGHMDNLWASNPDFQKHILGGIQWALGLEPGDASPRKTGGN
jgi:type 1 glutamine amidotransferase